MRGKKVRIGMLAITLMVIGMALWASVPEPEALPTCDYPQAIAPMQTFGQALYWTSRPGVAWNGREYGVAYADGGEVFFRRHYADGTPAAPAVSLAYTGVAGSGLCTPLLWNGSRYAVAWSSSTPSVHIAFAILDTDGAIVYGPTTASTGTSFPISVSLASSGTGYAVAWHDNRNGNIDIFASLLNSDGTVAGSGAYHDIALTTAANTQAYASIAWSIGGFYIAVWQDYRSGTKVEIYASTLNTAGGAGVAYSLVSGASSSYYPCIVSAGGPLLVAWGDYRDTNYEIYFARMDATGSKLGADVRLTTNSSASWYPFVTWTGGEYGIYWIESQSGIYDAAFQRVSLAGVAQGSPLQFMQGTGASWPTAAFATRGYLVATDNNASGYPGYIQPVGCSYAMTPPCPENALAYNISGTQATIAWLPAVDAYFDIAYYQVYRNNSRVGITSQNYYTDSGLALNTTYSYSVRTVNAGQQVSTGCPASSSVYVKTNASLLLMVDKSDPNAALTWTDSQPLNSYNVYRGTSPQVMQMIGTTSGSAFSDPNVLRDNILYFYTVDDPGQ